MIRFVFVFVTIFCFTFVNCANNCAEVYERGISEDVKKLILAEHNKYRSYVVSGLVKGWPKGKNLNVLGWDDKLAQKAQEVANKCELKYGDIKDDRFSQVGQLISAQENTIKLKPPIWETIIQKWYGSHELTTYPDFGNFNAFFAQISMNVTQYIGCGVTYYRGNDRKYDRLYVCAYGPGINVEDHDGSPTYELADTDEKKC